MRSNPVRSGATTRAACTRSSPWRSSKLEATQEPLVVYREKVDKSDDCRRDESPPTWVRPLSEWHNVVALEETGPPRDITRV